ncbi:tRNA pseudouridine(13) synthase TruD [Thalassotalea sp. HSM 43]|uniref:tRNA pseudouridine(13) synthase TruD n=1 Tax=Thalassotalea sp. HSM 43 TaxID=2552945 RepID=UPI0010803893|nr:tRNA pseudouridine(13) synthase TruD [Thalassotalea sp. HSM 43]QBY05091.1 tRNA pseudouridine(13) synthase TruD [Thalassotalea sp. HSM 43]
MHNLDELAYVYGKPLSTGDLRSRPEDFKVTELLPFSASGEGEHLLVNLRKTGANTVYVAKQLAKYFKVKPHMVTYAGLKDRNAVTEQFFGVHVPGKKQYDLSDFDCDGVEVLSWQRHNKKLKTGALLGNRFEITLRNVTDIEALQQRWQKITATGVANYFGEQRFGIDGNNLNGAKQLFAGKRIHDRNKRGFYLSAARSHVFNQMLDARIKNGHFSNPVDGDVFMLSGSRSVFHCDKIDDQIIQRLAEQDIAATLPLWGEGELMSSDQAKQFELAIAEQLSDYCDGLEKFALKQERRAISLYVQAAKMTVDGDNATVSFVLPSGCFATTVLRELLDYTDISVKERENEHSDK